MIIGISYPFPQYNLYRRERVFTVQGKPHVHFPLLASSSLVDRHYVMTSLPEVQAVAREHGCTTVSWDSVSDCEGVLPGQQMNNAMMDFIKADLGVEYEYLMEQTFLYQNLSNVLVRKETLEQMRDAVDIQSRPHVYLAIRIRDALGVVDEDNSMFSVLNNAPLEFEEQYSPPIVSYDHATYFSCEHKIIPGQRRFFAHQVSELEGLRVESEQSAKLVTFILNEMPDYHHIPVQQESTCEK
ncbi:MAG: hypothetical protein KKB70_11630 [Proteobacteria bacterium]|nr:hypothetical protein [Pseudomonadota bacterium]